MNGSYCQLETYKSYSQISQNEQSYSNPINGCIANLSLKSLKRKEGYIFALEMSHYKKYIDIDSQLWKKRDKSFL